MAQKRQRKDGSDEEEPKKKPRGPRGHGSVFERSDGRWCGIYDGGIGRNGKRQRKYVYGKTKTEAARKLRKAQQDAEGGKAVDPSKLTVGQYLDQWFEKPGRTWRPTTIESYAQNIRIHIKPRIGHIALQKLAPEDVLWLYGDMAKAGLSSRLQQYVHSILRQALSAAQRARLVPGNVCDAIEKTQKPKPKPPEVRFLAANEIQRLLTQCEADRLGTFYAFAVLSGMREGEMFALRWQDVDLEAARVQVRRTLTEVKRELPDGTKKIELVVGPPKSKKGVRSITLPSEAVDALRRQRKRLVDEELADCELVFPSDRGTFLRRSNVRRHFHEVLKKANLPQVRIHDLRHSHASLLLQRGVNPKVVQERLGHATISLTLDTYSHVIPGLQEEAAQKLDGLFGSNKKAPDSDENRKP